MSEQLGLFESATAAFPLSDVVGRAPLVKWSFSRRDLFERCLLWYYYRYYGSSARSAKTEPLKEQLRFLNALTGIKLRAGKILHLVISTYFRRRREGGEWTTDEALRWAQDIFRRDLHYSLAYQHGNQRATASKHVVLLSELYHGRPDAEAIWEEAAIRLQTALARFLTGPNIEQFRLGALHPKALIEKRVSLKEEHFHLTGQIDLVYPENGRVKVVDWKSGESGGSDDSLQLLSYALVTLKAFECSADSIDLFKVHLQDGTVSAYRVSEEDLRRARMRIIQDTDRMQSLDHYGREAVVSAFTPCQQPRICRLCPFQSLCPKR
jgi:CRISPR/Cas system-associated exonuclease Cas4 (RecB family)